MNSDSPDTLNAERLLITPLDLDKHLHGGRSVEM
jgi:hypothetical protein